MAPADKAVLRLTVGLGVAVLVAYGFALPMPFAVCVMAVIVLSKPGPPMPLVKGAVDRCVAGCGADARRADGAGARELPLTGLLMTAIILYAVFYKGLRQRQSRDDGARDGVRADPGGRGGRPGRGRNARA